YTLALAGGALSVALLLGLPAGVFLAMRPRHWLRAPIEVLLAAAQSLPTFWSGMLLVLVFAVTLGWLPPSSSGGWQHLVLPSLALGLMSLATFARVTRAALTEELGRDYVRSALSRGVAPVRLLLRHLSRNAALPVLSVAGLEIANLLAGAVIVENLFAWPGLGQLTLQAILARDFPLVQAVVMLGAFVTIGLNLATDLLYGVVDPRIRMGAAA
ncbi:MAG TPA: ABC transporter permease, partial [Pseudomonas sp.]|uniref:ABC transporter permease n=1 Tax=Pseudomonas sp. TaxID=306 RepID=UPI002B468F09